MDFRLEIQDYDQDTIERYKEIFGALIRSGGLTGVKGGKTIIHFDAEGTFQGIELDYWPWRRRVKDKEKWDKFQTH